MDSHHQHEEEQAAFAPVSHAAASLPGERELASPGAAGVRRRRTGRQKMVPWWGIQAVGIVGATGMATALVWALVVSRYDLELLRSPIALPIIFALYALPFAIWYRRVKRTLVGDDDTRAVGSLIEALSYPNTRVREAASDRLVRLLPCLTPGDAHLLSAARRAEMCRILSMPDGNPLLRNARRLRPAMDATYDLHIAMLQALGQVGDAGALPVVQMLAEREARTAGQERLRAAACECLSALEARLAQQRMTQTLVRPAAAQEDALLRAAAATDGSDRANLLRSVADEGEPTRITDARRDELPR